MTQIPDIKVDDPWEWYVIVVGTDTGGAGRNRRLPLDQGRSAFYAPSGTTLP